MILSKMSLFLVISFWVVFVISALLHVYSGSYVSLNVFNTLKLLATILLTVYCCSVGLIANTTMVDLIRNTFDF